MNSPPLDSEEALRAWVEAEADNIEKARCSVGFYMAGWGKLLDPVERHSSGDGHETLQIGRREDSGG